MVHRLAVFLVIPFACILAACESPVDRQTRIEAEINAGTADASALPSDTRSARERSVAIEAAEVAAAAALNPEQAALLQPPPPIPPVERLDYAEVQAKLLTECRPDLSSADCELATAALTTDFISMYEEQQAHCAQVREQILLSQSQLRRAFDGDGLEMDDPQGLIDAIRQGKRQFATACTQASEAAVGMRPDIEE